MRIAKKVKKWTHNFSGHFNSWKSEIKKYKEWETSICKMLKIWKKHWNPHNLHTIPSTHTHVNKLTNQNYRQTDPKSVFKSRNILDDQQRLNYLKRNEISCHNDGFRRTIGRRFGCTKFRASFSRLRIFNSFFDFGKSETFSGIMVPM